MMCGKRVKRVRLLRCGVVESDNLVKEVPSTFAKPVRGQISSDAPDPAPSRQEGRSILLHPPLNEVTIEAD